MQLNTLLAPGNYSNTIPSAGVERGIHLYAQPAVKQHTENN